MTPDILLVLGLLAAAMLIFTFEWLPVDIVAVSLLAALVLTRILTPAEAFRGFSSEIVIILCAIFVVSGALTKTGVMEGFAAALAGLGRRGEATVVGVVMASSAAMSAFLSNTNSTAVLMPAVVEYSKRGRIGAARLLMPLAYASMLGGACTLIGTSTNLAGSGLLVELGLRPLGLFELAPAGVVMAAAGIAYMALLGRRLLPRAPAASLSEQYQINKYLSEVVIAEESPLVGQTLRESELEAHDVQVHAVGRGGRRFVPQPSTVLQADDVLVLHASRENLLALEERPDLTFEATGSLEDQDLTDDAEVELVEAIVMPQSGFVHKTLRELDFRRRYGASVLAVHRRGQAYPLGVANVRLAVGDVLLLQGTPERLQLLHRVGSMWLLGGVEHLPFRRRKGSVALAALVGAIVAGSAGWVPLSIAFLGAVLVVVLAGCVTAEEMYQLIEWRVIVLIAAMTSFGVAMEKTGTADYLASLIATGTAPLGTPAVLGAFAVLTMVLTQPMSNAAAALVVVPVAASTATQLGIDPRSLGVLVILSASLSFIAPLEPACLLVYGPGKYQFRDFMKVGAPLSFVVAVLLVLLVPIFWPL